MSTAAALLHTTIPRDYKVIVNVGNAIFAGRTVKELESSGLEYFNRNNATAHTQPQATGANENPSPKRRQMSAAGRKAIAAATRKRWAAKRAAAGTPVASKPIAKARTSRAKGKTMGAGA